MRVSLLTNVLSPYRIPVFRDLAATPGLELRILLSSRTELHWREAFARAYETGREQLDLEVVPGLSFERRVPMQRETGVSQRVATHLPYGALAALRRQRPDVVVSSELGARSALAALYCALFRVPLVIWSYQSRSAADAAPAWLEALRRGLLARAQAVVGMGVQAREVLRGRGVPDARLFDAPNAHDAARYAAALAEVQPMAARVALRAPLRAREHVALVAGRLVESKGIEPLLEVWPEIPTYLRDRWTLLFVGDGPLAARVRTEAERRPGEIAHVESVPPERMPELYAAVDRLLFPSLADPWGLVVNEALACGVPVACSRLAGCAEDLIEPNRNGWLFDPTDAQEMRDVLTQVLETGDEEALRAQARDTAKRFGPERMAAGLRCAIQHAASTRRT
jgi:glycosyltransferase involved in cell wall biosynthesis